jgi:hypothetical protein
MSLEYQEILINGYINNTDKFGLLIGYDLLLPSPLNAGSNFARIVVRDLNGNDVDQVSSSVGDNGLTQTYMQVNTSNGNPKPLLIPPGYSVFVSVTSGAFVNFYGMLLLGTLDEIARVAIR